MSGSLATTANTNKQSLGGTQAEHSLTNIVPWHGRCIYFLLCINMLQVPCEKPVSNIFSLNSTQLEH